MLSESLELQSYYLSKLNVKWDGSLDTADHYDDEFFFLVDYNILVESSNPRKFQYELIVSSKCPTSDDWIGFEVVIYGVFVILDNVKEEDIPRTITLSGGTILYGILRGQIGMILGSFSSSSFILPALDFGTIVKLKTEKIRQGKKKAKKKVRKKKQKKKKVTNRKK